MSQSNRMRIEEVLGAATRAASGWRDNSNTKWVAGALVGVLLLIALWSSWSSSPAVRYVTEAVTRGDLVILVTATGAVHPTNKVDVSSELSGTVRRVLVDYNTIVKKGQTLAELDTDKLSATVESSRAKLAAARAKVADAEATVNQKQRELSRKAQLSEKQVTSAQDLDLAQADYQRAKAGLDSARADVGVAEADLKLNETNLAKACICSPIDGVVLTRNVDPGQTVASSFQAPVLFSIAEDLKAMELQVDVDEADVGKVKAGQSASFSVDAFPDRRFPAKIRDVRFASEVIQGVVTYKAVLTIDNSELLLRPGMTATADIRVTELKDALLVPNTALRFAPAQAAARDNRSLLQRILPGPPRFKQGQRADEGAGGRRVFVLQNAAPAAVSVETGASDGRRTEVKSGRLERGQQVVVDQIEPRS